ncbi:hypothetical protein CapIbe_014432 [Capra ibex]
MSPGPHVDSLLLSHQGSLHIGNDFLENRGISLYHCLLRSPHLDTLPHLGPPEATEKALELLVTRKHGPCWSQV